MNSVGTDKKVFYYHFSKLNGWTFLNAILTLCLPLYFISGCVGCFGYGIVIAIPVLWILWVMYYVVKHPAVVVDANGIKIDHCDMLPWDAIAGVREETVRCGFKKRRVLVLVPKEGVDYRYNFLQKHNPFPPFSIPLYGILIADDEKAIVEIVNERVRKTDNQQSG